jgi:hypothetical protein
MDEVRGSRGGGRVWRRLEGLEEVEGLRDSQYEAPEMAGNSGGSRRL